LYTVWLILYWFEPEVLACFSDTVLRRHCGDEPCLKNKPIRRNMQGIFNKIALLAAASLFFLPAPPVSLQIVPLAKDAAEAPQKIFLPVVSTSIQPAVGPRLNLPVFPANGSADPYFNQAAIFWFGKVGLSDSYADVRIASTQTELAAYVSVIDRLLWYTKQPAVDQLTQWDSVTFYVRLASNRPAAPDSRTFRFDSQFSWYESRANYQAAYQGNGNSWTLAPVSFTTTAAYRGLGGPNSGLAQRGWVTFFHIPYTSLGLSGAPPEGTLWEIAMAAHNRNSQAGPPLPDESWPEGMNSLQPASWAQLRFGIPVYTPAIKPIAGTTILRNKLNGVLVPDGNVGGVVANQCPGDENYIWKLWGNANYAGETGLNIQNQSNVDDWPCFSKYYITFPLGSLPANKTILKATLILHQWGGSGDVLGGHPPQPSYIQIFTTAHDFDPATISWNNGPQPLENVAAAWVNPETNYAVPWPKYPREWDVTRALAEAYASGQPLRLAIYAGDSEFNSGKYFSTSDTQDWNASGRPTLQIEWGN
jgi:hypothetical protein